MELVGRAWTLSLLSPEQRSTPSHVPLFCCPGTSCHLESLT